MDRNIKLLQPHTVDLYDLAQKQYELKVVNARSLLKVSRFDLFAKLAYIHYRESQPEYALQIYEAHIKAFNPDLKEPGRTDKNTLEDFIHAFDELIDYFKVNDFDPEISLIPLSSNGEILDGSHRTAALAYFDKEVCVLAFEDVQPVATFDYAYFLKRSLSRSWTDKITYESLNFKNNLFVACLWPSLGDLKQREKARSIIKSHFDIMYIKEMSMNLEGLTKFMYEIYDHQDWVGNEENNFAGARSKATQCYGKNKLVQFVVFEANHLEEVLEVKEEIRAYYQLDKHALHITDNKEETAEIFDLIFTEQSKLFNDAGGQWKDKWREQKILFKEVYLINLKVKIARILSSIGLRK